MQNNNEPVRKIRSSRSNLRGVTPSIKNGRSSSFESSLERDFLKILEFDPLVYQYLEQPAEIHFMDNGTERRYTPDVLVYYTHLRNPPKELFPLLVEVKYCKELEEKQEEFKLKFKAAEEYAKKFGWNFKVLTEKDIRTPYLENVKFLLPHKTKNNIDPNNQILLSDWLLKLDLTTPNELVKAAALDTYKQAELLYTLWAMIANNLVGCDLTLPLTMKSEIWTK